MEQRAAVVVERPSRRTCRGSSRDATVAPASSPARGVTVFSDENCSRSAPEHAAPAADLVEPLRQAPGSREARASAQASAAAASRTIVAHSSIRSACVRCDTMQTRSQYSPRISVEDRNTRFDALILASSSSVRLLVAAAHPERDDGELRVPADLDVRVGAQRGVDAFGQVELLVERVAERGDAVQHQREPDAQARARRATAPASARCSSAAPPSGAGPAGRPPPRSARRASPRGRARSARRCRTAGTGPCAGPG